MLKWCCLSLLLGLVGFAGSATDVYADSESSTLTLKDSITLGLRDSLTASRLAIEKDRLRLKGEKLETSKFRHLLSSAVEGSHEVEDAENHKLQSENEDEFSVTYKNTFENGAYWQIKYLQERKVEFEDEVEEKTDFDSAVLTFSYPLYGPTSKKTKLSNERLQLSIAQEEATRNDQTLALQIQIAQLFLEVAGTWHQTQAAEQKAFLSQKKLMQYQQLKMQKTALELRQLELEQQQNQLALQSSQATLRYKRQQLALYIGQIALEQLPQIPAPLPYRQTQESLEQAYLNQSSALQQLGNQIRLKQKDIEISESATKPDFILTANLGQPNQRVENSRVTEPSKRVVGRSESIFLTVSYPFGGGASEQVRIDQHALEQLNIDLQEKQAQIRLQAQMDFLKLQSDYAGLALQQQLFQLAEQEKQLMAESFRVGKASFEQVNRSENSVVQKRLAMIQAQVKYWQSYLTILEKQQMSVLAVLP